LTGLESLGLISIIAQHIKDNAFNKKAKKWYAVKNKKYIGSYNTEQQAIDRSGPGIDNKGDEAAVGAVEMALLVKCLTA
jgi:6,7-dimethyl-8-ribityllumazine synthase